MEKQQALIDNVDDEKHGNLRHFRRGILATGCQTWKSKQGLVDDVDNSGELLILVSEWAGAVGQVQRAGGCSR